MILFSEDYYKYSNIHIATETKNRSFLRMAVLLKRMGIVNNKFMLTLLDSDLKNIDPHNLKDNSLELKLRIARECKRNIWFHIREVSRVPAVGMDNIPYILNRANLSLIWVFMNNIDIFLIQPRQTGKTISALVLLDWLLHIGTTNFTLNMVTKGTDLVQENVARLKTIRDGNPSYLIAKSSKDSDNKEGLSYFSLNTKCRTKVAQASKIAARALCIGETVPMVLYDEFAYIVNNKLSYEAALPAVTTAAEQARIAGIPCASILSTTAGDIEDPSGKYAFRVLSNAMRFYEGLYDTQNYEELYKILSVDSSNRMISIVYSYLQLGKSHEWFEENTRKITDKTEVDKDYKNIWQISSSTCPVPKHLVDRMNAHMIDPLSCEMYESLILRWYITTDILKTKAKHKPYIIGMDTSDNVGRDSTTLYMLDPETLSTVCTCKCNMSNLTYVAQLAVKLLIDFPRSIFIPERNYNGGMLIDLVLIALKGKGINPWTRIYNTITQELSSSTDRSIFDQFPDGSLRTHFGFRTTGSSRKILYKSVLLNALEIMSERIYDAALVNEIKSLELRNGRIDHAETGHDDLCVSWLLSCYFVLHGKNFSMYGIREDEFLSAVSSNGNTIDPIKRLKQKELRNRLKQLEELSDTTTSNLMKHSFLNEIKHLKCYLDDTYIDTEIVSTSQAVKKSEEEAKHKKKLNPISAQKMFANFF